MKIVKITLYKIEIPTKHPFTTGFGTVLSRPTILVKAEANNGLVGWGETAPLSFPMYKPETIDTCMIVIRDYIAPQVLGKPFGSIEDFTALYTNVKGNYFAKTGLETATWMLLACQQQLSVHELLGGKKKEIPTGISVGIGTVEETMRLVDEGVSLGTKRIKLKIKPGWDISLVKKVKAKHPDVPLMVDGNSSYTLNDIQVFQELDEFGLLMIEQPLADDDIIDHSVLQKKIHTPICLDESISSAEDARKAISIGACKVINIKPGRVGGLQESKKIHDVCKKNKVGVWCGGMLETGVARAFNLATTTMENYIYPSDMDEPLMFFTDDVVTDGYKIKDGMIKIPQGTGIGFSVDEEKVKHYTTENRVL